MLPPTKPLKLAAIDFETELLDGTPSTEFYRHDFRAKSVAVAVDGQLEGLYAHGEADIRALLRGLVEREYHFVCHNLQFEWGVVHERFPELLPRLHWHADTQRLVQLGDNGAGEGVGLEKCARRWLPTKYHDHKAVFHALIAERGGSGGKDLHLLTPSELQLYNIADAEVTLELYKALTHYFKEISYDWQLDWRLYSSACRLTATSKIQGVYVDRNQIESSRRAISDERAASGNRFLVQHADGIAWVEGRLKERALGKYKTERGRQGADLSKIVFNMESDDHLRELFVDFYGIKPQFFTPTGKPSMSSKFFKQWGAHAEPLLKRGNQEITLNQLGHLYAASEYDGRLHIDVRINGTKTGRGATGDS